MQARIVRQAGVRGGAPTIEGTRITVTDIVWYYRTHLPELVTEFAGPPDPRVRCVVPLPAIVEEIRTQLPHLSPEQVKAALAYWYKHQDEVAHELQEEDAAAEKAKREYAQLP